jgi:predicted RNA-binding Zn-ribbon protein involved in translation (DUF1610 family)
MVSTSMARRITRLRRGRKNTVKQAAHEYALLIAARFKVSAHQGERDGGRFPTGQEGDAEDAEHLPRGVLEPSRPEGGPVRLSGDLGAFVCWCACLLVCLLACLLVCLLVWQCLLTADHLLLLLQIGEEWTTKTCSSCGHVNHHVGAHSVFCCPHCGLVADRDTQAAKNILGHVPSVLHDSHPELYKTCVDGTSLAVSAPCAVSRSVAVA